MNVIAEYLWIDGGNPTSRIRSKTRVLEIEDKISLSVFPEWSFDGSSTEQAEGNNSDCVLEPVFYCFDPTRKGIHTVLILCEVYDVDGNPHPTNHRAKLREILNEKPNLDA